MALNIAIAFCTVVTVAKAAVRTHNPHAEVAATESTTHPLSPLRPNIIFVLGDDMGYGDVGYNNVAERQYIPGAGGRTWAPNPPRTPNIDALANSEATLVFDRSYSGSPVCSPTRSSILSGRTPDRECIFNAEGCGQVPAWSCINPEPFPATVFTLAEATKLAGYTTLHAGKFHLGDFFPKVGERVMAVEQRLTFSGPSYFCVFFMHLFIRSLILSTDVVSGQQRPILRVQEVARHESRNDWLR